jgi:hypothetical protein
MTLHFAAARPAFASLTPVRRERIIARAANDNARSAEDLGHSAELRAALKHFAAHGVSAASVAQQKAERAFFRGDRPAYLHWLGICRTLDRRMAMVLSSCVQTRNA